MSALKIWNGSAWFKSQDYGYAKIWNGSSWVLSNTKHWDGNGWVSYVGLKDSYAIENYTYYSAAYAEASFGTNGLVSGDKPWITTTGVNSGNYEIYITCTQSSALVVNAGLNTWLNLGTARAYAVTADYGSSTAILNVKIRKVGDQAPPDSASRNIQISAYSDYPQLP